MTTTLTPSTTVEPILLDLGELLALRAEAEQIAEQLRGPLEAARRLVARENEIGARIVAEFMAALPEPLRRVDVAGELEDAIAGAVWALDASAGLPVLLENTDRFTEDAAE